MFSGESECQQGIMRRRLYFLFACLLLGAAMPASAQAYIYTGHKWPTTSVNYILSASLTSTEQSIVKSCATTWNNGPSAWTLTSSTSSSVYSIWSKTDFSYQGWPDVPGVTEETYSGSTTTKMRSWFNTDFTWNNSGVMDSATRKCDYKTVILHEFGHWISLSHDSRYTTAVMWPNWTTKQSLATDDKNGLDYVY